jgi:UDP-glucose 4-epimerase
VKTLVTGGAGFIGSHLVEQLLKEGVETRVYDNLISGNLESLASIQPDIQLIQADVRNLDALTSAMQGVDWVFHLAALTSVSQSVNDPLLTYDLESGIKSLLEV